MVELNRIARNSPALRAQYAAVYENLIKRSRWVVSAPGVFFWGGEHSVLTHGLAVCQQLPQRVYVGLELTNPNAKFQLDIADIDDGNGISYNPSSGGFAPMMFPQGEWQFSPFSRDRLINASALEVLTALATHIGLSGKFRLRVLSEFRPGAGLAWSGAFAAALIGAMFAGAGRFESNPWTYSWEENELLSEINAWAWELERWLQGGSASGYGTLCAMVQCAAPQLFALRARDRGYGGGGLARSMKSPLRLTEVLEATTRPVCSDEAWGDGPPLDCCLAYTGVGKSTAASISRVASGLAVVLGAAATAARSLDPVSSWPLTEQVSVTEEAGDIGMVLDHMLIGAVHTSVVRVLGALMTTINEGESEGDANLEELAAALDALAGGLSQLSLSWPHAELVRSAILRSVWPDTHRVGMKPTGGAHGGSIFFLYPKMTWAKEDDENRGNNLASNLVRELESVGNEMGVTVSLDWCSGRDGFEGGGLQLISSQ